MPGFNGERFDPINGTYHLGNGYRAYNPVLMRLTVPSGHLSWQAGLGIGLGALGIAAAVLSSASEIWLFHTLCEVSRHKSAPIQHASTKQLEAGTAIHLALGELEPIDMASNDAVAVGRESCSVYGIVVVTNAWLQTAAFLVHRWPALDAASLPTLDVRGA
ncbi:RHS repeat-associated core domain-containing protein [Mycetohabitans endofungorum]|uniref:hypothetical protein n=1 Tax=Mycetohabitans endofungorum TaxID=417203 RepID=UPI00396A4A84